jgi:hypothetical protein
VQGCLDVIDFQVTGCDTFADGGASGESFDYRFLLHLVFIRMRVVMHPRPCRLLGFRG